MAAPAFDRTGISRSHGLVREEPGVDNVWRRLRADSDDDCREAVEKANELHATGDLFAKQIEPEPAPRHLVEWAMTEPSDDEDDAPMPDAPPDPNLERCIALRLVYGAGPR